MISNPYRKKVYHPIILSAPGYISGFMLVHNLWSFLIIYSMLFLAVSFILYNFVNESEKQSQILTPKVLINASISNNDQERNDDIQTEQQQQKEEVKTNETVPEIEEKVEETMEDTDDNENVMDDDYDDDDDDEIIDDNDSYKYPKPTDFQIAKMKEILKEHNDFFASPAYLNLIPKDDKDWIHRSPKLKKATREEHEKMIDLFEVPDEPFKYKKDIESAIELFKKWRKWQNGVEWTKKARKEDMNIYSRSVPGEAIDIIKGEGVIYPYSTPIVLGVLLNTWHRMEWDDKLDELIKFKRCSQFSALVYVSVKTPWPLSDRDIVSIAFCYPFDDGSILIGTKSIIHDDYPPNTGSKVRATVNGDFWYLTPDFEGNINHTKVTLYSHISLGGSLPTWVVNAASADIPASVLKVKEYMKGAYSTLHEAGKLHIPPFPCLKLLGIDIGWMDQVKSIKKKKPTTTATTMDNNMENDRKNNDDDEKKEIEHEVETITKETKRLLFDYDNVTVLDDTEKVILLLKNLSFDMNHALHTIQECK